MGNQSQDEVFLAAQEAVGAHRDSQGKIFVSIVKDLPINSAPNLQCSLYIFSIDCSKQEVF